jgi:hypothetical protein
MAKKRRVQAFRKVKSPKARPKAAKAKSAKATKRPARLTVAELDARIEVARKSASERRAKERGLLPRMITALEVLQKAAADLGYVSVLKLASPPKVNESRWVTPWIVVGRFVWRPDKSLAPNRFGYAELGRVLEKWTRAKLVDRVGSQRLARMRVTYVDGTKRDDYTLAETQPWSICLARGIEQCDPTNTYTTQGGDRGSLASRYAASKIESLYVWLSTSVGANVMNLRR